ncbi:MAG: hypothetical protein QOG63_1507, partial [Thermoleophilaceae bacterium]|nr:hypothetical protein [Thermoleophilaceae bacterium]
MATALAVATGVKGLGALAATLAAGGTLLLRSGRARAISALLALVLAPLLLAGELWDSPQVDSIRSRPALFAAALVVGVVFIAALAWLLRRSPWLLAPLAVATLPFRVPLESGGESANLLIPLYAVVAAGVLAYAWDRLAPRPGADAQRRDPAAGRLEQALVLLVVLYALQSLYSSDLATALKNVAFFYVPFILLLRLLTSAPLTRRVVGWCFGVGVVLAVLFAGVGFLEFATGHLFWNQKVIA